MNRVDVKPEMLRWARERAGRSVESLSGRFPKLELWERGESAPTLKQLEGFAKATYTPVGYLFLQTPPAEHIPIPDFRTMRNERVSHPSPDLLETIDICRRRQEWYHDFARSTGEEPLAFVGSVGLTSDVVTTAVEMRGSLDFSVDEQRRASSWTEALRRLIEHADRLGILVMVSGVVGSNNRRKLDPEEMRGFALSDELAPLVFINGADTKAAQMFTLAHELAHLWLGRSGVSDAGVANVPEQGVESWCNRVAAEFLVPAEILLAEYRPENELQGEMQRLARYFKVSTLVILRRIYDVSGLNREEFWGAFQGELGRLREMPRGTGGNFYLTQAARVSKRFARALVISTLEGHTLHRDAFRLLGCTKSATFRELGHSLGVIA